MLFMAGMHLAIFSPKTGKLKELKVAECLIIAIWTLLL